MTFLSAFINALFDEIGRLSSVVTDAEGTNRCLKNLSKETRYSHFFTILNKKDQRLHRRVYE